CFTGDHAAEAIPVVRHEILDRELLNRLGRGRGLAERASWHGAPGHGAGWFLITTSMRYQSRRWEERYRTVVPSQCTGDPVPPLLLIPRRVDHRGARSVGQLGYDPDELAVEVVRRVLALMRGDRHQGHRRSLAAGQPGGDVAVVVTADGRDRLGPDDVSAVVLDHPHVGRAHGPTSSSSVQLILPAHPGQQLPQWHIC